MESESHILADQSQDNTLFTRLNELNELEQSYDQLEKALSSLSQADGEKALSSLSQADGEGPQSVIDKFVNSNIDSSGVEEQRQDNSTENSSFESDQEVKNSMPVENSSQGTDSSANLGELSENSSAQDVEDVFQHESAQSSQEEFSEESENDSNYSEDVEDFPMNTQSANDDSDEVAMNQTRGKRKASDLEFNEQEDVDTNASDDEERRFLLSLMPSMKKIRLNKIAEVRMQILEVLHKHRSPSTMSISSNSSIPAETNSAESGSRSISAADGEPALPNPVDLMNDILSAEYVAETSDVEAVE